MPSTVENVAMLVSGAVATTALSSAFVASGPVAQEARTGLRSSGYAKSSQSSQSMGAMAGVGAVAGLAVAGVAGRRAGKNRTSTCRLWVLESTASAALAVRWPALP